MCGGQDDKHIALDDGLRHSWKAGGAQATKSMENEDPDTSVHEGCWRHVNRFGGAKRFSRREDVRLDRPLTNIYAQMDGMRYVHEV